VTPTTKFIIKCVGIGLYATLVSLQVALPGLTIDDVVQALIAGAIGGLGYAGIGAATSLEAPGKK
jgi:hypothetical protein